MTLKADWVDENTPGKTAPDWTFTSSAANDVADAVNGLTEVAVSVKSYGAVGDGNTDDTTAIHAARDAAGVGGTVMFPPGIYLVDALALNVVGQTWLLAGATLQYSGSDNGAIVTISAVGVTLKGSGAGNATITSSGTDVMILLTAASDMTIANLTVESTPTGASSSFNLLTYNDGALQKRITVTGCRLLGSTNNAARFVDAVEQLTFADNIVEDCKLGISVYAPTVASGLISTQVVISRNRFRNVGGSNIQLYSSNPETATIIGVEINGNDLRDFDTDTSVAVTGPIPIEPNGGIASCVISGNVIDGEATRGISTGLCTNMVITGNVIRNQSSYAVELNGGKQISVVGNVAENCTSLAQETGSGDLSDVVIADNIYVGSGKTSYSSTETIRLLSAKRVRISGNQFYDWQYSNSAIRIGMTSEGPVEDCVVEGNSFINSDAHTPLEAILISEAIRTNVLRNTIRINRNLVADYDTGDDSHGVITAMMTQCVDTLIEGNHIMFTGTTSGAPDAAGIRNSFASADVCPGLIIHGNYVIDGPQGIYLVTTSTDLRVYDNSTSTCTYPDTIPSTADSGTGTVASYAGEITLPPNTDVITLTGTATVTSITASYRGRRVTLINTSTASLADGGNLKLSAAGPNSADDTITLVCDGVNWYEVGRSVN